MNAKIIHLHSQAPPKPAVAAPCNGCGVCCAAETCPAGLVLFRRRRGPCPALMWNGVRPRYDCGLVAAPHEFLRWLPKTLVSPAQALFRRWVAVGKGCDCDFDVES